MTKPKAPFEKFKDGLAARNVSLQRLYDATARDDVTLSIYSIVGGPNERKLIAVMQWEGGAFEVFYQEQAEDIAASVEGVAGPLPILHKEADPDHVSRTGRPLIMSRRTETRPRRKRSDDPSAA